MFTLTFKKNKSVIPDAPRLIYVQREPMARALADKVIGNSGEFFYSEVVMKPSSYKSGLKTRICALS